jgi:hypothetical protein
VNTYTLVYRSTARNRTVTDQAALMISTAPIAPALAIWQLAGLDLVSDTPSTSAPQAIRTVVLQDAVGGGFMTPGTPMAEFLTNFLTGSIAQGIVAPVTADPVSVT